MKKTILMLLIACGLGAKAQVKLQPLFTDNMVLQQKSQTPIWGETKPGKTVTVKTSWNKQTYTTQADEKGKWSVKVETPEAGGPYDIVISDGKAIKLKNVLIGEVWLCSGQSNMEMPLAGWGKILNYEQEIANAKYPDIRLLHVDNCVSAQPLETFTSRDGGWVECSPATIAEFSAAAYFFGRELHKDLNIPIGLISSRWGGTNIESWISPASLRTMPDFTQTVDEVAALSNDMAEQKLAFENKTREWKEQIEKADHGMKGGKAVYAAVGTDESEWGETTNPGYFNDGSGNQVTGITWFRKTIDIPADWEGKDLTLKLGPIDDDDITYFNGQQVGKTEGWMEHRVYTIPAKLVKKGKTVITVRMNDTGGKGGFYGEPESLSIAPTGKQGLSLAGTWKYKTTVNYAKMSAQPINTVNNPNMVNSLFNGMINPVVPYTIKGAIWYQGCNNAGRAYQYRDLMKLIVHDWRGLWGYKFPFYLVQLANFLPVKEQPEESTWAELREAQLFALKLENTGMACAIDIGDALDIHPKNKQEVGRRLALIARANTYGENIPYSGPIYKGHEIEGSTIRISFNHTDEGLKSGDGGKLKGFAIAGIDHKFHWADARIEGNTVVVSSPEVSLPVAVRYAWADNPVCNLYNGAGLPASPFRTDDWPGLTIDAK